MQSRTSGPFSWQRLLLLLAVTYFSSPVARPPFNTAAHSQNPDLLANHFAFPFCLNFLLRQPSKFSAFKDLCDENLTQIIPFLHQWYLLIAQSVTGMIFLSQSQVLGSEECGLLFGGGHF